MSGSPRIDHASFVEAYRQTAGPLRRYVTRVLGDRAAADDVVQESFTRALSSGTLPREQNELRAYIFRIASNLMKDQWRRLKREHARLAEPDAQHASDDPTTRMDLARLFAQLDLRERQLVWLAHVEGDDHAAIAVVLGVGEASVKVLLHRARKRFAGILRAAGYDPELEL